MNPVLSRYSASISELKRNPSRLIADAEGEIVAILNHNKPTAYLVPAETYEKMTDILEDIELARIVHEREATKNQAVEVSLDDL